MAIAARPSMSVLAPGQELVYVDYLETAPWNLRTPIVAPRFSGVGTVLMAEAIAFSLQSGLNGRVGLHSLEQATEFYERGCRMRDLGPDPGYYDLQYFEYDEATAVKWLTERKRP